MSKTVLDIANICQRRLQLPVTGSFAALTDGNSSLLRACMEEAMQNIRDDFPWPELKKEWTFTAATSTAAYALPGDLNQVLFQTQWNRTQKLPLIGPLSSTEWQMFKSGIVASFPNQCYIVKGWNATQFYIDPTPDSTINGQTMVFDYCTVHTLRPSFLWAATTGTSLRYCYYNMNIYDRGTTGAVTTGTIPPTHTSGTVSDGSINWTYLAESDECFDDTFYSILDYTLVVDGACWRFKRERGLDYQQNQADALQQLDNAKTNLSSAGILSYNRNRLSAPMIGPWSYPIQSIGS